MAGRSTPAPEDCDVGLAEPALLPNSYKAHTQLGTVSASPDPVTLSLLTLESPLKKYRFLGPEWKN